MVLFLAMIIMFFFAFVLFLIMNHRAIWNLNVTKLQVFIGKTDIQAVEIILVREIMGVSIIDRLNLQTEL